MEDYYRLLDIHQDATIDQINEAYKNKITEFKFLPFLTENDKNKLRDIKKAHVIFNNKEYKKIYDEHLNNKFKKEMNKTEELNTSRKKNNNQNILFDRIFSLSNKVENINLTHNELLRPKNVGLSADKEIEFDKPIDYEDNQSNNFMPFNFDI
jgi:DnaJ-class molecular chaperone